METPNYFSISPDSQAGDVYATTFKFASQLPVQYNKNVWNLGDNTFVYNTSFSSSIVGILLLFTNSLLPSYLV